MSSILCELDFFFCSNLNETIFPVAAALQSVFPQSELATFMSLTKADKEQQLSELTMIVSGIRLFNKDCRKGGEGIEDRKRTHLILHQML